MLLKQYAEIEDKIRQLNAALKELREELKFYKDEIIKEHKLPPNANTEVNADGYTIVISTKERKKPLPRKNLEKLILEKLGDTNLTRGIIDEFKNGGDVVNSTSFNIKKV